MNRFNRRKLCECGCGQQVSSGRRFVQGHHARVCNPMQGRQRILSEETKKKISDALKGENHPLYGVAMPQERKDKISNALIGKLRSENSKEKQSITMQGHIGYSLGRKAPLEERQKMSKAQKGRKHSEKVKNKIRMATTKTWANMSEKDKTCRVKKSLQCQSPNTKEAQLMLLLDELFPGEWKFVGNGQVIISGKCPDFININGQKKIIELFGDYWHYGEDPQDRINIFKPFGYQTLVLWERELLDIEQTKIRINDFARVGYGIH